MKVAKVVPSDEVTHKLTSTPSVEPCDDEIDIPIPSEALDETNRKQMERDGIPSAVWTRNLAEAVPPRSVHQAARPPVLSTETLSLLPLAARLGAYVAKERAQCRDPFFDLSGIDLRPPDPGPFAGVPLGGVGCGSINRGFRGDFRRWNLLPGRYIHKVYHACQFSLRVKHAGASPEACVLVDGTEALAASRACKEIGALKHWSWTMKPKCATYHALYPRAWTVYEEPLRGVRLVCRQISPVLGSGSEALSPEEREGEYVESSLPCAVFEWRIENLLDAPAEVSLMFTWEADAGIADNHLYVPRFNAPFERCGRVSGIEMKGSVQSRKVYSPRQEEKGNSLLNFMQDLVSQAPDMQYEDPFCFGLACLNHSEWSDTDKNCTGVTRCPFFSTVNRDPSGNLTAQNIWASFLHDGGLVEDEKTPCTLAAKAGCFKKGCCGSPQPDETGCSAICQHIVVPARGSRILKFALSWDVPSVRFGSGKSVNRWYTRFCGTSGDAAPSIAAWALKRSEEWEARIAAWQMPILKSPELPNFYKSLLFNELYFLSDGGSLWTDASSEDDIKKSVPGPGSGCLQNFGRSDTDNYLQVVDIEERKSFSTTDSNLASQSPVVETVLRGISEANAAACTSGGDLQFVGQFLYMEGHEYLMYNTYDVHFYASWALVMNWPQLQLSLQRDVISTINTEDKSTRISLAGRTLHRRKEIGVVPHDVGSPSEEPLLKVNTYNLQDVSRWKDLGPKFVLQVYRDFHLTKDISYLRHAWPTMLEVMGAMEKYDKDSDGLIENDGFPDQTYDIWTVTGASAYTGGLWVASLSAIAAAAEALLVAQSSKREMGDWEKNSSVSNQNYYFDYAFLKKELFRYKDWWKKARRAYSDKLWNGNNGYFDYDCSGSDLSDSCMSDQCAGQWWARACGLPSVCDEDASCTKASTALLSVLELNVYRFGEICAQLHGRSESVQDSKGIYRQCFLAGAVNGMRPRRPLNLRKGTNSEGQVDNSCVQSREVWTGVSYGLAACMLLESKYSSPETRELLRRGAFDIAKGVYRGGWKAFGYWFATPEAWEASGNVRCMGYMRPLCVWGMQFALDECKRDERPQTLR